MHFQPASPPRWSVVTWLFKQFIWRPLLTLQVTR